MNDLPDSYSSEILNWLLPATKILFCSSSALELLNLSEMKFEQFPNVSHLSFLA